MPYLLKRIVSLLFLSRPRFYSFSPGGFFIYSFLYSERMGDGVIEYTINKINEGFNNKQIMQSMVLDGIENGCRSEKLSLTE